MLRTSPYALSSWRTLGNFPHSPAGSSLKPTNLVWRDGLSGSDGYLGTDTLDSLLRLRLNVLRSEGEENGALLLVDVAQTQTFETLLKCLSDVAMNHTRRFEHCAASCVL